MGVGPVGRGGVCVLEAVGGDGVEGVLGGAGGAVLRLGGEDLERRGGEDGHEGDVGDAAEGEEAGAGAVEGDAEEGRDVAFCVHACEDGVVHFLAGGGVERGVGAGEGAGVRWEGQAEEGARYPVAVPRGVVHKRDLLVVDCDSCDRHPLLPESTL